MSNRYQTATFTSGTVGAGATVTVDQTIGPSLFNIVSIAITQDVPGSTFSYRIFKNNSYAAGTRLVRVENQGGAFYQPIDRTTNSQAQEGSPFPYDDQNALGQLHNQFVNNDSVSHVYTVTIVYEEVPKFDGSGNMTLRAAANVTALNVGTPGVTSGAINVAIQGTAAAYIYSAGAPPVSQLTFMASRGTISVPTVLNANDLVGRISMSPYSGSAFTSGGRIDFAVDSQSFVSLPPTALRFYTNPADSGVTEAFRIDSLGNNIFNPTGSLLTQNATSGFAYIPGVALGAPSGTPTHYTGAYPTVYDPADNAWWVYNGSWKVPNFFPTSVVIGSNSASSGAVNLANSANVVSRNAANSADVIMLGLSNTNVVILGNLSFQTALYGSDIQFGKALVALGSGATATLGLIGGSGPTTAAQNSWQRWLDNNGAAFWVPAWK